MSATLSQPRTRVPANDTDGAVTGYLTYEHVLIAIPARYASTLAATSVALTSKVYAGPKGSAQHEQSYFDRASKVSEGGI